MAAVTVELDDQVVKLMSEELGPVEQIAKEMIVLDLHRRGTISRGKAADLLGMERYAYIQLASSHGIPFTNITPEELQAEFDLWRSRGL